MKTKMKFFWLFPFASLFFFTPVFSQEVNPADSTGLPGDHFSLAGALELFKQAESPEDFEKKLNTESNYVNNLDLNEDGDIDYIRVVDNMDGDLHAIVLQVPVNESESQDVAVIEIEKTGDEEAMLQIIGDEMLYGENHIVEPYELEADDDGRGPSVTMVRLVVNVWGWPSVRFVYRPGYRVWVSPYRWMHYPRWWKPWRPRPWRVHYRHHVRHHRHFHVVTTHRVTRAHRVYTPRRKTSKVVHTRTTTRVTGKKGAVTGKRTTTKTTVRGKQGGQVTRKKSATTVKGKKGGAVKKKKTTTRARGKKRGG